MQRPSTDEAPDEIAGAGQDYLRECALLLVGATSDEGAFPTDVGGVAALIRRAAEPEPRPPEAPRFAAETPDQLPRFTGRGAVWVSPAGEGALRLRGEDGFLSSTSVVLHPDGRLGEFTESTGFGVPDSQLTEQARSDLEALERRRNDGEAEGAEDLGRFEEEEKRFGSEHLVGARVAPPQDSSDLVIPWIALYDTGVIVNYLLPRPRDTDGELERRDASGRTLPEPTAPAIELRDRLGTAYSPVGSSEPDLTGLLLRGSLQFTPAVPADVSHLLVRGEWGSVEIEVAQ